jgi:hypothetical protein
MQRPPSPEPHPGTPRGDERSVLDSWEELKSVLLAISEQLARIEQQMAVLSQREGRSRSTQSRSEPEDAGPMSENRSIPPGLFTEEEAIAYLRLDTIDIADRRATLRRYRESGHLRGTQVSKRVFYLQEELDAFLKRVTQENPR